MAVGKRAKAVSSVVAGRKPVKEALERHPEKLDRLLLRKGLQGLGAIRRAATAAGVPVQYVPHERLQAVAGAVNHQGIVAVAAAVRYTELNTMFAAIAPDLDAVKASKPILLALDRVQDPRNFGAIIRTAAAAWVGGIIVPVTHSAPITTVVLKASAGAALRIPIARTTDMPNTLTALKERGYFVAGTVRKGGEPIGEADLNRPLVLVVGSEGAGLRPAIADVCDFMVSIPMSGDVESLNVSVAAGVVLFMAVNQRAARSL